MSETTQEIKVYELAKELGMDSFALLDKLKENGIEVKNHMSSLGAEQTQTIRGLFKSKSSSKPATVTRKKAAPNGEAAATPAATTTTAAPAKRTVKKASADAGAAATAKAPAAKEAGSAAGKKKVIKRRSGAETADESSISTDATETTATAAGTATATPETTAQEFAAPESAVQEPVIPREEYIPRPNAPGTKASLKTPTSRVVEKDELLDEFVSRKLKIVKQAPPEGAGEKDGVTYRTPGAPVGGEKKKTFAKTTESGTEMFQPFTSVVGGTAKEEEGKRGRGGFTERKAEEIKISDFRKRELVFQPKKKRLPPGKTVRQTQITTPSAQKRKIRMDEKIIVSELAQRMGEKNNTIMAKLMNLGVMAGLNQTIDFDTAALIAGEFGYEIENIAFKEGSVLSTDEETNLLPRPPVITVMGHVDHGKTSLLDAIRNANVAAGEAGGITQHIGAYSVTVEGKPITFLDTPGHEAFANMRSRGANLTDIVVLVVAGDDSIMPQTKEAIEHATAANVPIVVAANKMDKPDANIERVKKDLSVHNLLVEDWGGQVPLVSVSALKKTGIKDLLETILLQAEVLELKANPDRLAEGVVLEARMEKGRGIVTDVLVKKGTLKVGDYVVMGQAYGRVRAMINDKGAQIKEAGPAYPAEIVGLNDVPVAGDIFNATKTEEDAKKIATTRKQKAEAQKSADLAPKAMTLDDLMSKIPNPNVKELNVLVKTDVFGSAEAIRESIEKILSEKVKAKVIGCTVGVVTENDILLAKAANAMVIGFNVKPDSKARDVAKREHVSVKFHSIIYELLDDVRKAMEDLLEPMKNEKYIGKAEVKQTFSVSKIGTIAGSIVTDGKVTRNAYGRVMRGKEAVHEGKIVSLKRFKDDASETIKGQECGIGIQNFDAYLPGDIIEVFHVEFTKQTL